MHRLLSALAFALCSGAALAAINLNTATKEELVALPGIGPAKAQAILDHRKANGPFKSIEELKDVKGIGAKRYEKLKGELTVAGAAAKPAQRPAEKAAASPQRSAKARSPWRPSPTTRGPASPDRSQRLRVRRVRRPCSGSGQPVTCTPRYCPRATVVWAPVRRTRSSPHTENPK